MPTRRSHESEPDTILLKRCPEDWCSLYIYLGRRLLGISGETFPNVCCRGLPKLSPEKEGRDRFYFINDALERCSSWKAHSWSASLRTFPSFMEPKSLLSCSKHPSLDPIIGQMSPLDRLFYPLDFVISGFPAKTYFRFPHTCYVSLPSLSPWVHHFNNILAGNFTALPVPWLVMCNFLLSKGHTAKLLSVCWQPNVDFTKNSRFLFIINSTERIKWSKPRCPWWLVGALRLLLSRQWKVFFFQTLVLHTKKHWIN
jgi:hypothetical protein